MYAPDNRKKDNFFAIALACILSAILFCGLAGCSKENNTNPPNTQMHGVEYVECGTCGAHVVEWWKVRNDANTTWVNVCGKCYDAINE